MTIQKNMVNNRNLLMLIIISILIFSQELRTPLGNIIYTYNILALTSLSILFIRNIKNIEIINIVILFITVMIYLITSIFYEKSLTNIFGVIFLYIVPLSLILIKVDKITFKYIFKYTLIILNIIIIILTVILLLDSIFGIDITLKLSQFMSEGTQKQIIANSLYVNGKRMYSFMGHPLFNAQLYLMFFILNILYNKYLKKHKYMLIVFIITALGISATGSKTGFILFSITTLTLFENNTKYKKILIIIIGILIAFKLGLFDTVIGRFLEGSITTGRSEKWSEIQSMNLYPLRFFLGYGRGFTFKFNDYIDWASAAFEYPIRMFALEFGILMSLLIYIFIFIIPVIKLFKKKYLTLLFSYGIIFFDINTYNGLACTGDKMIILCLFIFLILNLSEFIKN